MDLQEQFEPKEVAAVCQCAGNSRGFSNPRVAGGQWGHGAMGNAMWKGVRLRDLLENSGLENDARHIRFDGLDRPVADATPDFLKSLPLDDATADHVLVAYAMNGEPLPFLNGFPLRLVVPGWYATYWVKMLNDIEVLNQEDHNFWMDPAYRIPDNACGCLEPEEKATHSIPISTMKVRSFITNMADGDTILGGSRVLVKGIAFDQGYGIDQVLFSSDGGQHWQAAKLGKDYGDYSFRQWETHVSLKPGQRYQLQSLALNRIGESQQLQAKWNPNGAGICVMPLRPFVFPHRANLFYDTAIIIFLPYYRNPPCGFRDSDFGRRGVQLDAEHRVANRSVFISTRLRTGSSEQLLCHLSLSGLHLHAASSFTREVDRDHKKNETNVWLSNPRRFHCHLGKVFDKSE